MAQKTYRTEQAWRAAAAGQAGLRAGLAGMRPTLASLSLGIFARTANGARVVALGPTAAARAYAAWGVFGITRTVWAANRAIFGK